MTRTFDSIAQNLGQDKKGLTQLFQNVYSTIMHAVALKENKLYFAYGSNLWQQQMQERCPESKCIGAASITGWKWIISARGYPNIIQSPEEVVYGLVYDLNQDDESRLDIYEGVPETFEKQVLEAKLLTSGDSATVLLYVDTKRITEFSELKSEYVHRMNMGITDALAGGVPEEFITNRLRKFVPESS